MRALETVSSRPVIEIAINAISGKRSRPNCVRLFPRSVHRRQRNQAPPAITSTADRLRPWNAMKPAMPRASIFTVRMPIT
jgi:hypothetical protein